MGSKVGSTKDVAAGSQLCSSAPFRASGVGSSAALALFAHQGEARLASCNSKREEG